MWSCRSEPISSPEWEKPKPGGPFWNHGSTYARRGFAAGLSRRLGRPMAMVQVNGRSVVRWVCDRLRRAGCHPVVVVNEQTASDVGRAVPWALLAVNPNPDAGRTGSLQLGLTALV